MVTLCSSTILGLVLAFGVGGLAQSTSTCSAEDGGQCPIKDKVMLSTILGAVDDLKRQHQALQTQILGEFKQMEDRMSRNREQGKSDLGGETSRLNCSCRGSSGSSWLRLVNGNTPTMGRLEVLHNGEWGTVCDDDFGSTDAQIFCKTLGFPWRNAIAKAKAHFGQGSGQIWLDSVRCYSFDSDASDCRHAGWGINDCSHGEDVGIICA